MDSDSSPRTAPAARRRVGRPSTLESGGASLATVLTLIRSGAATTRLDIEREAELGRAVVADRLATLERLGLIVEGDLGPAIGGRAPRNMRFNAEAGATLAAHVDRESLAVGLADLGSCFAAIVSAEEVAHGKPAPDVYELAASELRLEAADCVAVEDSANGLRAAAAAGMAVIAIPNPAFPPPPDALTLAHITLKAITALDTLAVEVAFQRHLGA
jgi:beta-phosphoglucomutase-like phosphatase (HAD superfamily)